MWGEYNQWTGRTEPTALEWRGGPFIRISRYVLHEGMRNGFVEMRGSTLRIGPYCCHWVETNPMADEVLVMCDNLPGRLAWLGYRSWQIRQWVNVRLLVTLSVWGLSTYKVGVGEKPTWQHVKRRFRQ